MNVDHAARVLAYQRQLAAIRGRLVRYSHGDQAADRLARSVRDSQRVGLADAPPARPDRPGSR